MSRAKRRDEWDRMSQLLAMVFNRTIMSESEKGISPIDCFPDGLLDDNEKGRQTKAKQRDVVRVPFDVMRKMVLGK